MGVKPRIAENDGTLETMESYPTKVQKGKLRPGKRQGPTPGHAHRFQIS